MITLTLNEKSYQIPSAWSEICEKKQFISLSCSLFAFECGKIDFQELKMQVVFALTGIDINQIKTINETLSENIFRLSEFLTFPYHIEEIGDGDISVSINIMLNRNFLPIIGKRKGYKYITNEAGVIDTDLNADTYIDAITLLENFTRTLNSENNETVSWQLLNALLNKLYPPQRPHYIEENENITQEEKIAVYYNFRGILESIKQDKDYDLIFNHPSESSSRSNYPTGQQSSIFMLSKAGYGDINAIKRLDIFTYLNALTQQTIDSITTLAGTKMKPVKIAEKLNLTIEQVLPFVSEIEE